MRSFLFAVSVPFMSFMLTSVPSPAADQELASAFYTAPTEADALQAAYADAQAAAALACFGNDGRFDELTAVELTLEGESTVEASVVLGFRCSQ